MKRLLISAVAVFGGALLAGAPPALADSAVSPSGLVSASTPLPVLSGVVSTYTITLANPFSSTLTGGFTGIQLPAGLTLKATSTECGRTNKPILPGTALACNFPDIPGGGSASVSFTAVASSPGSYSIAVSGQAMTDCVLFLCSTFVRDSLTLGVNVSPGPTDIQVTGSASAGSPPVGSPFTYTFQVKDNGPQAAYGVTFDDSLPASVTLVGVSTNNGVCAVDTTANSVHCDIGLLGVGQQSNIVVTAVATAVGAVTNVASIAMANPDTHLANNSVGLTVQPK